MQYPDRSTRTIIRFCIPNFGMIFDCAFPKKARSEKRNFQCFAFRKSDSTSFPRVAMQNKMESVEGVEQDQGVVKYLVFYDSLSRIKSMCTGQTELIIWVRFEDEDGLMVDQVIQQLKTRLANYSRNCLVLSVGSKGR